MVGGCEGGEGGVEEREAAGERGDGVPPSPVRGVNPTGEGQVFLQFFIFVVLFSCLLLILLLL